MAPRLLIPGHLDESDRVMSLPPTENWSFVPRTPGIGLNAQEWRARHAPAAAGNAAPAAASETAPATEDGFSFWDLVDVVNPLQHLPVVGTLYREVTGDDIGGFAKVVGGGLFGGVAGAVAGLVDVVLEQETGSTAEQHVLALFDDAPAAGGPETAVAAAEPAAPDPAGRVDVLTPRPAPEPPEPAASAQEAAPGPAPDPAASVHAARLAQLEAALEAQGLRSTAALVPGNSIVAAQVEAAREAP